MLKILFDSYDSHAEARRYFALRRQAEDRGRSYHGPSPRIRGGIGVELGQCSNCAEEMWVRASVDGWGYCQDCRVEKKKRGIRMGFE